MKNLIYIFIFTLCFAGFGQSFNNAIIGAVSVKRNDSTTIKLGEKKAFPTAEGFAYKATGNQTDAVYHVSNLNATVNTGTPGSLANIRLTDNITVVFDVAGEIDLDDHNLVFRGNNVTLAFETAPAPGITIRGGALQIAGSNYIIRQVRCREGYSTNEDVRSPIRVVPDITSGDISNIIFDHLSVSWTMDQNVSLGPRDGSELSKVTFQNSFNSEALENYATIIGKGSKQISMIRNFFHSNRNRIPESPNGSFNPTWEFINNLVYNYNRPTVASYGSEADVLNNVYHAKEVPEGANMRYAGEYLNETDAPGDGKVFDSGNIQLGTNPLGMYSGAWDASREASRINPSTYMPIPATEVIDEIFDDVGATAFADSVDARLRQEYIDFEGHREITDESEVGGFPNIGTASHSGGYWATGNRVSQDFKDSYAFSNEMTKPVYFIVNGMKFDNKEYEGGTYVNADGETQNEYIGGTWTGEYNYTYWDFFRFWKAKDFETYKWQ